MTDRNSGPTLISSVQRAFRILDEVSRHPGGILAKAIAHRTGVPLPTTYHLLRTLVHEGYLVREDDGAFVLGARVAGLGAAGRRHAARAGARQVMAALRDRYRVATYLSRYRDGEIELVEVVDSTRSPRVDMWVDFRDAGHATALGKCLLGELDARTRADHFTRHPPADLTPRTTTCLRDLVHREQGRVAVDYEEYRTGVCCLAVPVRCGRHPTALGLSVPPGRLGEMRDVTAVLAAAAERIAVGLSAADPHLSSVDD
ncbi:IclR family transcriptional regulator [Saccharopolyspora rosea]|uniref:IclR family transcriptional regulator n=1 Tax=Saccharopolyspora rosea TaxID=524884 RepID=A0ABW3FW67_9PSEU|nr:helix-turn-helix domain-containing protein [Saccharopolyspora rosea]